jgi:hypothetical protein
MTERISWRAKPAEVIRWIITIVAIYSAVRA